MFNGFDSNFRLIFLANRAESGLRGAFALEFELQITSCQWQSLDTNARAASYALASADDQPASSNEQDQIE